MQCDTKIFTWKNSTLIVESKTINLNLLYEIKLHRFTCLFYSKDLLFNTYNLIHVHNVTTFDCSNEYTLVSLKGCWSSTLNSKLKSFEWEISNGVASLAFSKGDSFEIFPISSWSLTLKGIEWGIYKKICRRGSVS